MLTIHSLVKEVEGLSANIRVKRVDSGLRVSGNTYPVKGKLKLLGFQWNPRRREWYYGIDRSPP